VSNDPERDGPDPGLGDAQAESRPPAYANLEKVLDASQPHENDPGHAEATAKLHEPAREAREDGARQLLHAMPQMDHDPSVPSPQPPTTSELLAGPVNFEHTLAVETVPETIIVPNGDILHGIITDIQVGPADNGQLYPSRVDLKGIAAYVLPENSSAIRGLFRSGPTPTGHVVLQKALKKAGQPPNEHSDIVWDGEPYTIGGRFKYNESASTIQAWVFGEGGSDPKSASSLALMTSIGEGLLGDVIAQAREAGHQLNPQRPNVELALNLFAPNAQDAPGGPTMSSVSRYSLNDLGVTGPSTSIDHAQFMTQTLSSMD